MNKKETLILIEQVRKQLFQVHDTFPKNTVLFVSVTDIGIKDFPEVCKELNIEIAHPNPSIGENRLMACYHYAYGDIILKSEAVTFNIEYVAEKK